MHEKEIRRKVRDYGQYNKCYEDKSPCMGYDLAFNTKLFWPAFFLKKVPKRLLISKTCEKFENGTRYTSSLYFYSNVIGPNTAKV